MSVHKTNHELSYSMFIDDFNMPNEALKLHAAKAIKYAMEGKLQLTFVRKSGNYFILGSIGVCHLNDWFASNAAAAESNAASARGGATNCKPTGKPSFVNPHGIDKAGQPVGVITNVCMSQST